MKTNSKKLRALYPGRSSFDSGRLCVGDGHSLYYEQFGNPKGKPVVILHGGPGGGTDPNLCRYYNPAIYRIVVFDQRGAGLSTPHASLVQNTTWKLVEDIEKLRTRLGIDCWQVFGASWGSTLAILYSECYAEHVSELVLCGIFLFRRCEISWFYQKGGANRIYPDRWAEFEAIIPREERSDMLKAYYQRLMSDQEETRHRAAGEWSKWENSTSTLAPNPVEGDARSLNEQAVAMARIECHYFLNGGFMEENQLLRDVEDIRKIPAVIVQGRYDVVCPMQSAYDLHQAWPEADFRIVSEAGHSALEPRMVDQLVLATDMFGERLS